MLHILFLILKIIGIILLVILGIAVVLVGIVLFVPIRYRIKAETTDSLKGLRFEAKATWLLHLIAAYATYQNEDLDWQARIAWKKLNVEDEPEKPETAKPVKEKTVQEKSEEEKPQVEEEAVKTENVKKDTKKAPKKPKEKVNWLEKIKCTIREFCDKIKNIKDYLTNETHIQALVHLKNELVYFVKKIKPDKIKGYLRFGLEDPYNTGQVLAILSILYPFYGENVEIYPEFDKEIIEGDIFMKGRIYMIHLVIPICKLYFDNNIKTAYENFKALK